MDKLKSIIVFVLLFIFVVGAGYKFNLSQYEEECYQYKQIVYTANYTLPRLSGSCHFFVDYLHECKWVNLTYFYNSTKDGECIKYHLVRKI